MSKINELYKKLSSFKDVMEFNKPLSDEELNEFESKHNIAIPTDLTELLKCFNGGELFIPGITIYGIGEKTDKNSIRYINDSDMRQYFNIPKKYLIFGKTNYGNYICINLNNPYDIIEWDHELDEEYYNWTNMEQFLTETIEDNEDYGTEEN